MKRKEVIPAKDGLSVFVSGVAGCGKTTFIDSLTAMPKESGFEIFGNKIGIRQLIRSYRFKPPSMVLSAGVNKTPSVSFLRDLIQWQLVLSNLHTQNMMHVRPKGKQALILDRSALDSLVYLLYDIVNWNNEMTSISKTYAQAETAPKGDSGRVMEDFIKGRASGMVLHLMDTTIGQVLRRRRAEEDQKSTRRTWFSAIESNVYEVLKGTADEDSFLEILEAGEPNGFHRCGSIFDFKEQICKPLAYILSLYVDLIIDTPGVYLVLTHNPHKSEIEKDDVRMTDMDLVKDLDNITNYALMGLYVHLKRYEDIFDEGASSFESDFTQLLEDDNIEFHIQRPEGGHLVFAKETPNKNSRYADVERDTKMRVKWASELSLSYMRK